MLPPDPEKWRDYCNDCCGMFHNDENKYLRCLEECDNVWEY